MTPQPRVHASQLKRAVGGSQQAHQSLITAALSYLAMNGIPAVPIHTGARLTASAGGRLRHYGNPEQHGMSDILATLPPNGRAWLIEGKTGTARRSPAQVRFHERFARAGALVTVIRQVSDLEQYVVGGRVRFAAAAAGGTR